MVRELGADMARDQVTVSVHRPASGLVRDQARVPAMRDRFSRSCSLRLAMTAADAARGF
jgi:hypothetical protein